MVVQHNISAMNANRYYGINNKALSGSLEKLSSGYSINKAGDNAAGLAVSEKMRAQIGGLTQASKNAEDGISMVQTFEGALQETDSILQRMRTLAVQSANGNYQDDVDREAIQLEFDQLNDELNQIADTDFNGVVMLNGGQMADGTKADGNGKIDYKTATREAMQVGTAGGIVKGISTSGNTATQSETAVFTASVDSAGDVTWTVNDGALNGSVTQSTNKQGGFTYAGVAVHVDTSKIVNGDTLSLKFDTPSTEVKKTGAVIGTTTSKTGSSTAAGGALAISVTDANVADENIAAAINGLNGLTVRETTGADGETISSTTFNGVSVPTTTGAKAELYKVGDTGSVFLKQGQANKIFYNDGQGGSDVQIAAWTANTFTAATTPGATTLTSKVGVSQAIYKPATDSGVELVEPKGTVSKSDSNDASTATLTYTDNMTLQVGARTKDSVNFTLNYNSNGLGDLKANMNCSARTDGLGTADLSLKTQKDANAAIDKIDNALNKISMVRATFGAVQNRLEHKINNIDTNTENITAAESRIRDTQMDKEMMKFTSSQILSQASQSMLAQANSLPQGVLQLLG